MPGFQGARIETVDALRDFRAALVIFLERATTAMGDVRQKIDRTVAWLELDRPGYWRDQERRAYDQVAANRVAYETCRMRTVAGRHSDCIEEKKAFERSKARLEYVHVKQKAVRKWMVEASKEANEFRARTSSFQRTIDHDVPLMIAQLGRMIDAIEAYSGTSAAQPTPVSNQVSSVAREQEPSANESALTAATTAESESLVEPDHDGANGIQ